MESEEFLQIPRLTKIGVWVCLRWSLGPLNIIVPGGVCLDVVGVLTNGGLVFGDMTITVDTSFEFVDNCTGVALPFPNAMRPRRGRCVTGVVSMVLHDVTYPL